MIEFFTQNPAYLVITIFVWFGLGLIIEGAIAEKYTDEILIWFPKILKFFTTMTPIYPM